MGANLRSWLVPVGRRVDGEEWKLRIVELRGASGPTTAFVGGMYGDKALSCMALHELKRRLESESIRGRVILVPALNLPAFAQGSRNGPDQQVLNRRFPGSTVGSWMDQLASALFHFIQKEADCVVDLQSGTPTMGVGYTYSFGDDALAAAFGYLPVITNHYYDGQLTRELAKKGIATILTEHGGGPRNDTTLLVEGCLNILRYREQLDGELTGPRQLPVVSELRLDSPSVSGILLSEVGPGDVGTTVSPGLLGRVIDVGTGETLETFDVERAGALLLLAVTTPKVVQPADLGFMIGYSNAQVSVPRMNSVTTDG